MSTATATLPSVSRPAPEPAVERPIFRRDIALAEAKMLDDFGYSQERADKAIAFIRAYGTAQHTKHIDDEHRDAIEAVLEMDPNYAAPQWNRPFLFAGDVAAVELELANA